MSTDELIEIPRSEWLNLRDLYLENWPTNLLGYHTIDNYIQLINRLSEIEHLFIYSLNDDWADGTFVVIDRNQLALNTLNESNERLTNLLLLLDWSQGFFITSFRKRHHSAVLEVIQSKKLPLSWEDETLFHYMPKEESRNLNTRIPDGITVSNLSSEQVEYAHSGQGNLNLEGAFDAPYSVWPVPFKNSSTLNYLHRLAELYINIALMTNDGKLVSWCCRLPTGPLGALQVDSDYRRKGFGILTLKLMAIKLAEIGHDTCGCVALKNIASQEMFKKCGFKVVDNVYFMQTLEFNHFE